MPDCPASPGAPSILPQIVLRLPRKEGFVVLVKMTDRSHMTGTAGADGATMRPLDCHRRKRPSVRLRDAWHRLQPHDVAVMEPRAVVVDRAEGNESAGLALGAPLDTCSQGWNRPRALLGCCAGLTRRALASIILCGHLTEALPSATARIGSVHVQLCGDNSSRSLLPP